MPLCLLKYSPLTFPLVQRWVEFGPHAPYELGCGPFLTFSIGTKKLAPFLFMNTCTVIVIAMMMFFGGLKKCLNVNWSNAWYWWRPHMQRWNRSDSKLKTPHYMIWSTFNQRSFACFLSREILPFEIMDLTANFYTYPQSCSHNVWGINGVPSKFGKHGLLIL